MKIAIEARWITFQKTGFGRYAHNLLKELAAIDYTNEYFVYLNNKYNDDVFHNFNFNKITLNRRSEMYKHIHIPIDIISQKRNFDFFHFLYNAPSLLLPCPFILTIHDVSYKYIPRMISVKNRFSILFQLHLNARRAKRIITISEMSKRDVIRFFRVPPHRISVIYQGVDDSFRAPRTNDMMERVVRKYNLPEKFILYVGTYLPHKNLDTLLSAYHDLKHNTNIKHALVLAGKRGRNYSTISKLISKLRLEESVLTVGFVPDEDLPYLYTLSDLFVFPSLYEGFGLPLLEAMASGVPVIASKSSCLPEICGDAAVYFPPRDSKSLAENIHDIIHNEKLRVLLINRGFRRQQEFSWRITAKKTHELYEAVHTNLSPHFSH